MKTTFLVDFLSRFFKKNPKGWKYFQIACLVVFGLSWLVDDIQHLPKWVTVIQGKLTKVGTLLLAILAQLPNPKKDENTY